MCTHFQTIYDTIVDLGSKSELHFKNLDNMRLPELYTISCFIIVVHLLHLSLYSI